MINEKSQRLFNEAKQVMPGGVSSPVRAFGAVGGNPIFIEKAKGAYIWDVDGNQYIDYVASWGPAIVGHAHETVVSAVTNKAQFGLSFGAPTEGETLLAQKIIDAFPSVEMVRFVSSGTEACLSAIRLARGFTKRSKILKFTGNYHGHSDMLLAKAGSGVATFGLPDSAGVPKNVTADTLVVPYNDFDAVKETFANNEHQIAAVIIEPIVGNAGFIKPINNFLKKLREITTQNGTLLIFDEVMTGFRVAYGGYQVSQNIKPDLTTLGKVVGGGMPLAAYCGRKDIMENIAPAGPVYQAGTLSGNPLAVTAGLETLKILNQPGQYEELNRKVKKLVAGMEELAQKHHIPLQTDYEGGMFGYFFHDKAIHSYEDAQQMNKERFAKFHSKMLAEGIYWAPSAFEASFMSLAHTDQDIEQTLTKIDKIFSELS